jgi:hypothetical protein
MMQRSMHWHNHRGRQIGDNVCLLDVHSDHGVARAAQLLRDLVPYA